MPLAAAGGLDVADAVDATAAFAVENPSEALLAVIAVAAVLAGAGWLWLRLRPTPGERFRRTLASRDEVAVLMHPNPDPDAMSC
jgi:hypothetical protein